MYLCSKNTHCCMHRFYRMRQKLESIKINFLVKYFSLLQNFDVFIMGPTSGGVIALKTDRRVVSGSISSRACRTRRLEFSVVFSETRVNTSYDPLKRPSRRARHLQAQVRLANNWLQTYKPTLISLEYNAEVLLILKKVTASSMDF